MTVKTRFAPSPTGYLHIGGVRTALFCWLYARRHGGQFLLRIEDTDRARSTQASIEVILEGMQWVGLDWDEEPIFQTDRFERYDEVLSKMLADGYAYHCYCTPEELEEMRAAQKARGENPRYDGRCRERTAPLNNERPVIRFKTPSAGDVVIEDLVHGRVTYANAELDDLIIMRSDGTPTYHFGVVVDDADMGITHVIRGDDHLNNTPRQINLIDALGFTRPHYAHLPMILGEDGARLSKRHGAVSVLEYREKGYLPEALLNYLARLGWSHGDQEIFAQDELIAMFDLADVNASASRFNPEKLEWLNQQYIMAAPIDRLADLLRDQFERIGIDLEQGPEPEDVVEVYRERATSLGELAAVCRYLYVEFDTIEPKAAKKHLRPVIKPALQRLRTLFATLEDWSAVAIQQRIQAVADEFDIGFGKLGQPLRVAVTGSGVSPPIDQTTQLVGRDRTLLRIDGAIAFIEQREIDSL